MVQEITKVHVYQCGDCGYEWNSTEKLDNPTCPKCSNGKLLKWDITFPDEYKKFFIPVEFKSSIDYNDPCINCSNNPKNGGTGICHCTLPSMRGQITYTAVN